MGDQPASLYVPEAFQDSDALRLAEFMREFPFATLISTNASGAPLISHLPLLFTPDAAVGGRLLGHLANANPQVVQGFDGTSVVAVFHGPHAYVSQQWHRSAAVPTWNYAVVHVSGTVHTFTDGARLEQLLDALTKVHESQPAPDWRAQLSADQRHRMLEMIVGLDLHIDTIQGKFKLSQNRPLSEQQRVIAELARAAQAGARQCAEYMARYLKL